MNRGLRLSASGVARSRFRVSGRPREPPPQAQLPPPFPPLDFHVPRQGCVLAVCLSPQIGLDRSRYTNEFWTGMRAPTLLLQPCHDEPCAATAHWGNWMRRSQNRGEPMMALPRTRRPPMIFSRSRSMLDLTACMAPFLAGTMIFLRAFERHITISICKSSRPSTSAWGG